MFLSPSIAYSIPKPHDGAGEATIGEEGSDMGNARTRREFLKQVAAVGTVAPFAEMLLAQQSQAWPSEKLNLGVIGVGGRGAANLAGVATENIVAICDVDLSHVGAAKLAFSKATVFQDFRKLLGQKGIDAVVVSTPDHMHAIPAVMAMRLGMHVYCEKPLAHSVHEARVMRETAVKQGVATQMGTQIHAGRNYRDVVDIVRSGAIGPVRRVHVWFSGRPATGVRVKEGTPPASLDYDLWLGPAPYRPYHPSHCHFNWRWWFDFGGGTLGDFGCHYMDLPFWALELTAPTSIVAKGEKDHSGDNDAPGLLQVDYQFPERGSKPAVHMTWYHGGWGPDAALRHDKSNGILFIGEAGELIADYGSHALYPEEKFKDYRLERVTPDSPGHHEEWLAAIRNGGKASCPFEYSGPLTETVLLGNASYRAGKDLVWDADAGRVTNDVPGVASFIEREYRNGWTL